MNIVYNEILVHDPQGNVEFVNSNIPEYNIHPWHTHPLLKEGDNDGNYVNIEQISKKIGIELPFKRVGNESQEIMDVLVKLRSQSFEVFLDHDYHRHNIYSLEQIKELDVNYIYPIVIYNNVLFEKYDTITLNPDVVSDAKKGKCKICFMQPTEGFFGQEDENYKWLDGLSKTYGLDDTNLFMITTNFIAKSHKNKLATDGYLRDDSYTILDYGYFGSNLWFHNPGHVTDPQCEVKGREKLSKFIKWSLTEKKKYHFLNFNRVPKLHRVLLYGYLNGNSIFKDKFISSLGGVEGDDEYQYYGWVDGQVPQEYHNSWKTQIRNYYKTHDSRIHYWYDEPDLENNKADSLNIQAHKDSFVNIVSESLTHDTTVFFSEKIYKPIFVAQPFLMVGNPRSLEVLRGQGYKTFSKWWDESYDEETDLYKRMDKIFKVMGEIATWDMEKCYKITQEMLPTLIHNFNVLMKGETLQNIFNVLENDEHLPEKHNHLI
jgi:hypothetical protein